MSANQPSVAIFYHFFPPDDVISGVLFGELSSGLVERGWQVTAYPCVWSCHQEGLRYASEEKWNGVLVRRLWRPRFRQISGLGRLCNAAWMILRWSLIAIATSPRPDIIIIGTDPVLSVLVAPIWKRFSKNTAIAHWCFDLYPEAAVADGLLSESSTAVKIIRALLRKAYSACTLIVDIGPCMRRLLSRYDSDVPRETITPWALEEPGDSIPLSSVERNLLFGDVALALLYSGSFGRAHSYEDLLDLAERLEGNGGLLAFSVRGNREAELRDAARKKNIAIRFVPFVAEDRLQERLACADVHVVSLHNEWTGTVLPSKFFGALAAGRPILFAGSHDSSIAKWINRYRVGWVLNSQNIEDVAKQLSEYAGSSQQRAEMQQRCSRVYNTNFSRNLQLNHWDALLRSMLDGAPTSVAAPHDYAASRRS